MRGFATGVGCKADTGAPPEKHDTTATHRHPWWAEVEGVRLWENLWEISFRRRPANPYAATVTA